MATLRASRRNGCCLIKGHHPSRAEHTPEWKECKSRVVAQFEFAVAALYGPRFPGFGNEASPIAINSSSDQT